MRRYGHLQLIKRPIAILSLIALLVAQAAAGSHAARHLRAGGDGTDIPGVHTQVCLECASFAPLASAHGSPATALAVAALGVEEFMRPAEHASVVGRVHTPYRSRAPPR